MSKALYRKYRSKSFDEVVGQEHITDTLKNAIKKGAISHAYLFTGPKGVGKTSIARILAHAINDLEYSDESTHLDIIEIDAASNRRIDEMREIRDKVNTAPTSAKYKVYIIDEVHMLTREAFNALLKTLEEPPAHVVFILATTEAHKVPDTILSRTQRFTFKPVTQAKVVAHLREIANQENIEIDDEALKLLADHGNGSFRDSISMLDQLAGITYEGKISEKDVRQLLGMPQENHINELVKALNEQDVSGIFNAIQLLKEQGVDSGKAAQVLSARLRQHLLNNDKHVVESAVAVAILKNILPLTTKSQDYIGLEVALIDSVLSFSAHETDRANVTKQEAPQKQERMHKPPINSSAIEPEPKEPEPEKQKTTKAEVAAEKSTIATPAASVNFDDKNWKELLNALKKQHNTLYGVLRMADASLHDGILSLEFGFAFHKKQIDVPKNTGIIKEFISQYFGVDSFETKVVNKQKKEQPTKPKPPVEEATNAVTSVSNIFGGAELLES